MVKHNDDEYIDPIDYAKAFSDGYAQLCLAVENILLLSQTTGYPPEKVKAIGMEILNGSYFLTSPVYGIVEEIIDVVDTLMMTSYTVTHKQAKCYTDNSKPKSAYTETQETKENKP